MTRIIRLLSASLSPFVVRQAHHERTAMCKGFLNSRTYPPFIRLLIIERPCAMTPAPCRRYRNAVPLFHQCELMCHSIRFRPPSIALVQRTVMSHPLKIPVLDHGSAPSVVGTATLDDVAGSWNTRHRGAGEMGRSGTEIEILPPTMPSGPMFGFGPAKFPGEMGENGKIWERLGKI